MSIDRRGIVGAHNAYVIYAGRNGVGAGDVAPKGMFWIFVYPVGSSQMFDSYSVVVDGCDGLVSLSDVKQHDPTTVPFTCQATGAKGTLNAITKAVALERT